MNTPRRALRNFAATRLSRPVSPPLSSNGLPGGNLGGTAGASSTGPRRIPTPLIRIDPGWMFLLVGIGVITTTVLIPAQRDLAVAQWHRDKALAVERHRQHRVGNYAAYLQALDRTDQTVVLSLAATHLNRSPETRVPLSEPQDIARTTASVFPQLEPPPMIEPAPPHHLAVKLALQEAEDQARASWAGLPPEALKEAQIAAKTAQAAAIQASNASMSLLERWATDEKLRLWVFAGGILCILIGLLPAAKTRGGTEAADADAPPDTQPKPA